MRYSLIFTGQVDHGKSSSVGRFLYEMGQVPERVLSEVTEEASLYNVSKWALISDVLLSEKESGKTKEFNLISFEKGEDTFEIVDTPGHKAYLRELLQGINEETPLFHPRSGEKRTGVLILSSILNEFSRGMSTEGVGGQTLEDALILRSFGVDDLIVVVNKLDESNFSVERFLFIKEKIHPFLRLLSFKKIVFVPLSAHEGVGFKERHPNFENEKTFLEAASLFPLSPFLECEISEEEREYTKIKVSLRFIGNLLNKKDFLHPIISTGKVVMIHYLSQEIEAEILHLFEGKRKINFLNNTDFKKEYTLILKTSPLLFHPLNTKIIVRDENELIAFGNLLFSEKWS